MQDIINSILNKTIKAEVKKELSVKQLNTVKGALRTQGLMTILRGHYTQALLDHREYEIEDFDLAIKRRALNKKQKRAYEKSKKVFVNRMNKDIKEFDKFIASQLDKIEAGSQMMTTVLSNLTDVFDMFFNKVFQFKGVDVNIINKQPYFFVDLEEYAESLGVPMSTIKMSIENKTIKTVIVDGETKVLI